jgi:hypothetical protein
LRLPYDSPGHEILHRRCRRGSSDPLQGVAALNRRGLSEPRFFSRLRTCKNNTPSTDAFGAGAVPWASRSVSDILAFAATTGSSPWATGAFTGNATNSSWYGTDRTKQEILKNVFDQINNQLAFSAS